MSLTIIFMPTILKYHNGFKKSYTLVLSFSRVKFTNEEQVYLPLPLTALTVATLFGLDAMPLRGSVLKYI